MPDNAAVYAPIHMFPTEEQLQHLIPEASFEVDAGERVARCDLGGGVTVRLSRMPDPEMGPHLTGFRNYVLENGGGHGLAVRVASTLSVFGMVIEPGFDDDGRAMRLVSLLTGVTDGLCFLGGEVYDPAGNGLLIAGEGPGAPDARRVAARAAVLMVVSFRGLLEQDAGTDDESKAEKLRGDLVTWLMAQTELVDEIEKSELTFVQTPIGDADEQQVVDGVWQAEGAQVLLWAVGERELPDHDDQEHPYDVARAIGVLSDGGFTLLDDAALRDADQLDAMRRRLLGIHWRLREYRVKPGTYDFRAFADAAWFGGFDLDGIAMAGDDLSIGATAIHEAPTERVGLATSIALERHRAINWLIGAHPVYTRVTTPT